MNEKEIVAQGQSSKGEKIFAHLCNHYLEMIWNNS